MTIESRADALAQHAIQLGKAPGDFISLEVDEIAQHLGGDTHMGVVAQLDELRQIQEAAEAALLSGASE